MANALYNSYKKAIGDGTVDYDTDTIKIMLVTSTYVPNIDTHVFVSDITNEVVGTGYTAGGATLANKLVSVDTVNNLAKYEADDVPWTTSTITARGAVVYKDTGVTTTSPLLCYVDFTEDKSSSAGTFTIVWPTNGIFTLN